MQNYQNVDGYIYVIEYNRHCKIGYSVNPKRRIRQIQSMLPTRITSTFISCLCPDVMRIEEELHRKFNEYRSNGEWFDIRFDKAVPAAKYLTDKYRNYSLDKLRKCNRKFCTALEKGD